MLKNCYRYVVPKCDSGVDTWPKVFPLSWHPGELLKCTRRTDVPLSKQFILWRGDKQIVVGEEDLQTAKISSVLKVSSFYCNKGRRVRDRYQFWWPRPKQIINQSLHKFSFTWHHLVATVIQYGGRRGAAMKGALLFSQHHNAVTFNFVNFVCFIIGYWIME